MPIVFDPSGTPNVVFVRDGTALVELSGSGTSQMGATEIPAVAGHVIVRAATSSGNDAFILDADFAVGETVELAGDYTNGWRVYPQSGGNFFGLSSNSSTSGVSGRKFIKKSSTEWLAFY